MKTGRKGPGVTESIKVFTVNVNWAGLVSGGSHEKRLLNNLLDSYNVLERPVGNESDPLVLSFGLTLMQIIDVGL
ncbi:neuronal acetylcholine receptor subunit alpha-7-like isoform X1 [Vespula maculifrons]|uniref:Neuronal acetylcholine receptor subunit alpha-7-like isoform X1 n=1 Tax=Vespula maculifrons TaxID=7453 RepID=A0ABD2CGY0_VESMC